MSKKRWRTYAFGGMFLVLIAVTVAIVMQNQNSSKSGLQEALRAANIEARYDKVPPMRSEMFPVDGYETNGDWCIAKIHGEEIFHIVLESSAKAADVYQKSMDEYYTTDTKWILLPCENDVVFYKGTDSSIIILLNSIS